jgi:hypothetical protein
VEGTDQPLLKKDAPDTSYNFTASLIQLVNLCGIHLLDFCYEKFPRRNSICDKSSQIIRQCPNPIHMNAGHPYMVHYIT